MKRACYSIAVGLLVLPSYAAAQELPANPPSGYFDDQGNPTGNVDNITYGSNYPARVYTPPGYSESETYASMYLMHGLGGSERSWNDNDLYAHIQLDNLIAEGAVDPFIIVFTKNDLDNWNFEGHLIDELIPYIEENYSVSTDPEHRALGGLSMGGMQTVNIGFPNADLFRYLMPASSAPGIQGENQLFPDGGELARNNLKLVFFSAGENEIGAYGEQNNTRVMGYCENAGISSDIIFEYFAPGGGHDRNTWRPSFWNFAQLAYQAGLTDFGDDVGGGDDMGAGGTGAGAGGADDGSGMTGGSGGADVGMGGADTSAGGTPGDMGDTGGGSDMMDDEGGQDVGVGGATTGAGGAAGDVRDASGGSGTTDQGGGQDVGSDGVGTAGDAVGAPGGATGTSGVGTTDGTATTTGTDATGVTMPGADDTGTTGATDPTTGVGNMSEPGGIGESPGTDAAGCGCLLSGRPSQLPPLTLFAAAAALVLGTARIGRRRNRRG